MISEGKKFTEKRKLKKKGTKIRKCYHYTPLPNERLVIKIQMRISTDWNDRHTREQRTLARRSFTNVDFLFLSQRASLLESAPRKILFFISLNLMYLALKSIVFRLKQIQLVLSFNKNTFPSDFTICFYDRNTYLMICGNCKIIPLSKISIWPCRKDKK